jgi:hypothetical protein
MADIFSNGIPSSIPVSDEEVKVEAQPFELLQDSDIQDIEGGRSEEIPTAEAEYVGDTEDLGGAGGETTAEPFNPVSDTLNDSWNIEETMNAIGEQRLDTMFTILNNMTRKFVEKNLNKPPRRDLTEEEIKRVGISEQIIRVMHTYAPSLPMNNPTTGLFVACLTLGIMNMTSPLLTEEEIARLDKKP